MATIVDGVKRLQENGIKVIVIGAGVAGLQAALECWRKGCNVVVIEKDEKLSSIGDFFTIGPSGSTTVKDFPSMHSDYHKCVYDCSMDLYTPSGTEIFSMSPEWKEYSGKGVAPDVDISFLKRRSEYARMQVDQAERLHIPIHWADKFGVEVTTASGKKFDGDLYIGASGIGSTVPGFDFGSQVAVQDSGYAIARVAFPRTAVPEGSLASELVRAADSRPRFRTYIGNNIHLILYLTPNWLGFAFTHPDLNSAKESWGDLKDPSTLIHFLEEANASWDPAVLDFVRAAPSGVVDWKLRWRDGAEQWTSSNGRLVLMGDAAHAFFPTSGNDATQGIEDAVSLAECLSIGGKDGVVQATKVHNKLRFERVNILQLLGFVNREELHNADVEAIMADKTKAKIGYFTLGSWSWNHDPEAKCLAHLTDGKPFQYTNVPPGHAYQPWTLESENKRLKDGAKSDLKSNGYWGM
ncbi:unnamed protein product [Clonostachys rosea]|uniref:FAD-binding domain-containing protein n=1 Tax=Bionectria ochroleuca TaxID=29856 RepID=A0ABY6U8D7_BIOOC|nr:unnamed protein product [Clonostachys rosea]